MTNALKIIPFSSFSLALSKSLALDSAVGGLTGSWCTAYKRPSFSYGKDVKTQSDHGTDIDERSDLH